MIPEINISTLFLGPGKARDKADDEIYRAASDIGFLTITGIPGDCLTLENRKSLLSITPGIRLKDSNDDQSRVMTPKDAINLGANFLVIGRPITEAENIKEALLEIHNSL